VTVLEAVTEGAGDGERIIGALYHLEERRGAVARWPVTRGHAPAPMEVLLEGPPGSVLWRLEVLARAIRVRDTRHRVTYLLRPDGDVEVAAEAEEPTRSRERVRT
jgi:hypothetical protein